VQRILPPACLVLALLSGISGFALLATPPAEIGSELHRARAAGDVEHAERLEAELGAERRRRWALIGGSFAGAAFFTLAAFLSMRPSRGR
jgi:hypothetical protein